MFLFEKCNIFASPGTLDILFKKHYFRSTTLELIFCTNVFSLWKVQYHISYTPGTLDILSKKHHFRSKLLHQCNTLQCFFLKSATFLSHLVSWTFCSKSTTLELICCTNVFSLWKVQYFCLTWHAGHSVHYVERKELIRGANLSWKRHSSIHDISPCP